MPSFTVFVYLAVIKGSGSVDYLSMRAQGGISWKLIQIRNMPASGSTSEIV